LALLFVFGEGQEKGQEKTLTAKDAKRNRKEREETLGHL